MGAYPFIKVEFLKTLHRMNETETRDYIDRHWDWRASLMKKAGADLSSLRNIFLIAVLAASDPKGDMVGAVIADSMLEDRRMICGSVAQPGAIARDAAPEPDAEPEIEPSFAPA
jgi:hypothetical protein